MTGKSKMRTAWRQEERKYSRIQRVRMILLIMAIISGLLLVIFAINEITARMALRGMAANANVSDWQSEPLSGMAGTGLLCCVRCGMPVASEIAGGEKKSSGSEMTQKFY